MAHDHEDGEFIQVGALPLPIPARHCRPFREGQCRRGGSCTDLHLTCPDGRNCRDAQCIMGHPRNHPQRLEPLPDEVCNPFKNGTPNRSIHFNQSTSHHQQAFRVDQERLAEIFPDGPPRELLEAASAAMAGAGFPAGLHPTMGGAFPFGPGVEPGGVNMEAVAEMLGSIPQLFGAMEQGMGASVYVYAYVQA
jgi:hypothetical protein